MAKKQNEVTPNVNATANRDIVQRLNFLYQASVYLQSVAPEAHTGLHTKNSKAKHHAEDVDANMAIGEDSADSGTVAQRTPVKTKKHNRKVGQKKTTGDLARSYVQCMRVVGQKTTVKIDPSLKRSLCSNCSTTLIPGSSATVHVKKSSCHGHIMIYTCTHCKATKRIPAPPNSTSTPPIPSSAALSPVEPAGTSTPTSPDNPDFANLRSQKYGRLNRPLPLFARRDAGHVVFRGNERIVLDDDADLGVCFA